MLRPHRFENPVLSGFHPDPSLCRAGDRFILATSSFEYFPGVPLFESRDLVHWRAIGHALHRNSQLDLSQIPSSQGIYAPTIRYDHGRFYLVTTLVGGKGNLLVTARRPEGPWSEPVWLDREGFDPSLFFDEDGQVYYTRTGPGRDFRHPRIYQTTLNLETGRLRGRPRVIFEGTGGVWSEAPHLYRRGDYYYLVIAEGGTSYGHSVVVARAKSPMGPFLPCPDNPVLSHRGTRHPIQATGHADWVELPDGGTWAVLLGIRPHRGHHHHLGRETFLVPVSFGPDGWPRMGNKGRVEPVMTAPRLPRDAPSRPSERDHFDAARLSPEYLFVRNPVPRSWSLRERPGWLRLWGTAATIDEVGSPCFVGRPQPGISGVVRTCLDFTPGRPLESAGMVVRANERFHYDLLVREGRGGLEAVALANRGKGPRVVGRLGLPAGPVWLEIRCSADHYELAAGGPRHRRTIAKLPTRCLAAEYLEKFGSCHFTGAVIGLYATGQGAPSTAPADFDFYDASF